MKSSVPVLLLEANSFANLVTVSGSQDAAIGWLVRLATRYEKPIGISTDDLTMLMSPTAWSEQRLDGFVDEHRAELQAVLGPIDHIELSS